VIVDASVAFKWFADEENSEQALALILQAPLFAPTLLLIELGSALWKKARREQIDPNVSFEDELAQLATIMTIVDERAYVPRALTIARTLGHPIYDCVYLALAEAENKPLVTADARFLARLVDSPWRNLAQPLV
jgi:predicted nucleic acid-binding protein